jgi:hypothetical protein
MRKLAEAKIIETQSKKLGSITNKLLMSWQMHINAVIFNPIGNEHFRVMI